jgi:hypothetical protein
MMTLQLEILVEDGKKHFAVLPYEEFMSLKERPEDMEDLLEPQQGANGGRPEAHGTVGAGDSDNRT